MVALPDSQVSLPGVHAALLGVAAAMLSSSCGIVPRVDASQDEDGIVVKAHSALTVDGEPQHDAEANPTKEQPPEEPTTVESAPEPKTGAQGCPSEMVDVEGTCIDRFEAHLVVREDDGTLKHHPAHERPPGDREYLAQSAADVQPQAYISRNEAAQACEAAGKRLCTLDEWYGACTGSKGTTYPYGSRYVEGRCNVGKKHLLAKLFGSDPRGWHYDDHFNNPVLIQTEGYLSASGAFDDCKSDYGVYDMVGNLHEWIADRASPSIAHTLKIPSGSRRALHRNRGNGVFMGGFFSTLHQHGKGCNFVTTFHGPRYHDYSTGFRCCADR